MASHSVTTSKHATLVASTVDTVTLGSSDVDTAYVVNIDGAAIIYATGDGTTPTVAGDDIPVVIPALAGAYAVVDVVGSAVKLISAGTPKYAVIKGGAAGGPRGLGGGASASATAQTASLVPATTGGLSIHRNIDAGVTATTQIAKASAGQLYGYFISNNAATARFVKVYNKATAPTEADTPVLTFQLPAASSANVSHPNGVAFSTGISYRASTGRADNDTGATTTGDVIVNLYYA